MRKPKKTTHSRIIRKWDGTAPEGDAAGTALEYAESPAEHSTSQDSTKSVTLEPLLCNPAGVTAAEDDA